MSSDFGNTKDSNETGTPHSLSLFISWTFVESLTDVHSMNKSPKTIMVRQGHDPRLVKRRVQLVFHQNDIVFDSPPVSVGSRMLVEL